MKFNYLLLLLLTLVPLQPQANVTSSEDIRIGVLSHRGDSATAINWAATASYLSNQLPGYRFVIVPLDFDEVEPQVENAAIDFILVNPSIYVMLEVRHRITRITTLSRVIDGHYQNRFGGVLFTLKSRNDIKTLADIRGKTLMAVDPKSLGGYQMAIRELSERGIAESDYQVQFAGIHDDVVRAVLNAGADVGTVRSGILESMQKTGQIDITQLHIINPLSNDGFNQLHSTRLYPEWPFSKLPGTTDELAQKVAIALMQMPDQKNQNTKPSIRDRWTIPLEYQPVHELLQALKLPPYEVASNFTLKDALRKYWLAIVSSLVFIMLLVIITMLVIRLNNALKKSNQRLERQHSLILNSVADGICGVDLDGNSTFVNKSMERLTGWTAQDMIGKNQHAMLHHTRASGELHPQHECPVYQTFRDNKSRFIEDDTFWRADGSGFPVEYSCTPLKDENNQTIGSVTIFRDISERKKAQKEARKFRNELAHMARISTMGEMASGMAHELNQPLTAISTSADACIRLAECAETDRNKLSDTLEIISLQAKRAGAIIQQLRNFVRKEIPQKSAINLNEIIREVLILIQQSLEEYRIRAQLDLDESIPPVLAQHIQIDQVILNLVKNAIEAMSQQSDIQNTLQIRSELYPEKQVCVSITDSGQGVSSEIRQRLFTPFSTSKKDGMGLGLSISHGIIAEHGGELKLLQSSSQGSTFQFCLPAYEVS